MKHIIKHTITYPSILKVITKGVHVTRTVIFKNIPKLNNRPGLNKRKSPNHLESFTDWGRQDMILGN